MPRGIVHKPVGTASGLVAAMVVIGERRSNYNLVLLLASGLGGWYGGTFPDVLDPPDSPNHRAFFHSVTCNGGLALSVGKPLVGKLQKLVDDAYALPDSNDGAINWDKIVRLFIAGALVGFAAGYASHIALDMLTARSLPIC